jgi:hypothetical protein
MWHENDTIIKNIPNKNYSPIEREWGIIFLTQNSGNIKILGFTVLPRNHWGYCCQQGDGFMSKRYRPVIKEGTHLASSKKQMEHTLEHCWIMIRTKL